MSQPSPTVSTDLSLAPGLPSARGMGEATGRERRIKVRNDRRHAGALMHGGGVAVVLGGVVLAEAF